LRKVFSCVCRRPDGVSATEFDRAHRADTELQAFPGSSPAVQMKHIARVGVARRERSMKMPLSSKQCIVKIENIVVRAI
jgi:hypothetical protein